MDFINQICDVVPDYESFGHRPNTIISGTLLFKIIKDYKHLKIQTSMMIFMIPL